MSVSTDLSEMLKAKQTKININNDLMEKLQNLSLESKSEAEEEFPKLRKPKEATMLKIQQRYLRKSEGMKCEVSTKPPAELNILNVPLHQEFLNKKEEIVKSALNIIKKYESNKTQEQFLDKEPQPLTFNKDLSIKSLKAETNHPINTLNTSKLSQTTVEPMTYNDWHLINILHTKIKAHSNGFFANNIPNWYKTTFDKIIPENWLDVVKDSKKFSLENINTKIVLYAEGEIEKFIMDPSASGDGVKNTKCDGTAEQATGFVRYKHLEKSLQKYKHNAGREVNYKKYEAPMKPSDRLNKSNLSKINMRYKRSQVSSNNK